MSRSRRNVRQMPKIYGNLNQGPKYSGASFFGFVKKVLFYGLVLAILYTLFFSNWFTIKHVEVKGTSAASVDEIKSQVPMGSNMFRFSKDQVVNHILQQKEIDSVSVFKGLPSTIKVVVTERKPALCWISGDSVTITDKNGLPFMEFTKNTIPKSLEQMPCVTDTKSLPVDQQSPLVSSGFISFIDGVMSNLALYLPEARMDHFEIADTTSDLTYIGKSGLQVQFNSLGDPAVQVRNLTRLIHQKKAAMNSKIDLRIDRWAYVRP